MEQIYENIVKQSKESINWTNLLSYLKESAIVLTVAAETFTNNGTSTMLLDLLCNLDEPIYCFVNLQLLNYQLFKKFVPQIAQVFLDRTINCLKKTGLVHALFEFKQSK